MASTISTSPQRYLFYLHGKIVEDQGAHAVDTVYGFGAYEYDNILDAFRTANFEVLSELREKDTDPVAYARKISGEVDHLLHNGVQPVHITIVGASKGAIIAMLASSFLKNKDLNFVLIAGCMDGILQQFPGIQFCGNILSIYESSDHMGKSCSEIKSQTSLAMPHYKEIELHTGLGHGFLYKPLAEWVAPAIRWAGNNYS